MSENTQPIVWTIAGSDPCCGAGLASDILTFQDFNVHPCQVTTMQTVQNPDRLVQVFYAKPSTLVAQLTQLEQTLRPDVIKLGVLGDVSIIDALTDYLKAMNQSIIYDPVIQASSGVSFLTDASVTQLKKNIFPAITLLTPNRLEAEILWGKPIRNETDRQSAAAYLLSLGVDNVLIKGGHFDGALACDYFANQTDYFWMQSPRQRVGDLHGTGCLLSAAIAAAMALGYSLKDSVVIGKMYLNQGIRTRYAAGSHIFLGHSGFPNTQSDLPWVTRLPVEEKPIITAHEALPPIGFYPIVDSVEWVSCLLKQGVKTIQLRIKNQVGDCLEQSIKQSILLAHAYQARLFINDYWSLAIKYVAYGVHLGQEDLLTADMDAIYRSGLRVGISTHCFYEVACAHAYQPTYIAYGPIYHTHSKPMAFTPQGIVLLHYWTRLLAYPVVAIGGIDLSRVRDVLMTGVNGVAVLSAVTQSDTPEAAVVHFLQECEISS